jgi:transaldolase
MKICLATAKLDQVRWAATNGLIDAVATSPALLHEAGGNGDPRELLREICRESGLPVWAAAGAVNAADIYREGRELAKLSDQIVVQLPIVEDAIGAMHRLSTEGVPVAAMYAFNAAQALLAAKAGASLVSTSVDELEVTGAHGFDIVRELRRVFDADEAACDIVASLPRNSAQFAECALAGADVVTVTPETLHALLLHPLTDISVDHFLNELSKHSRSRQPT